MPEKDKGSNRRLGLRAAYWPNRPAVLGNLLLRICLPLLLAGTLFTGCASVPKDYPRTPSAAFEDHAGTAIGRYFAKAATRHPGESGFAIMRYGRPAFTSRVALTDLAEKTLDLQYYIWEADSTGHILAERLVRAADRGVRVRILLDDINLKGRDAVVASLDAHPNIEIRLFNPFAHRTAHGLDFIADFNRVNHRMHTKAIVFDRQDVFIGSFNLDPRSSDINTEAGLYVESPELAAQVIAYMDEGVLPRNSYRVLLDEDGDLYWTTEDDGTQVRYDRDPESGAW